MGLRMTFRSGMTTRGMREPSLLSEESRVSVLSHTSFLAGRIAKSSLPPGDQHMCIQGPEEVKSQPASSRELSLCQVKRAAWLSTDFFNTQTTK